MTYNQRLGISTIAAIFAGVAFYRSGHGVAASLGVSILGSFVATYALEVLAPSDKKASV
jgi:hypothetical protein